MRTVLLSVLTLCPVGGCGNVASPSGPSSHRGSRFADITAADQLQYVRPADQITRPDLVSQRPRFVFETDGTMCPQSCDAETWDGTTLSCVSISHVPADLVTIYVVDPARAGVNGNLHGAYRADSISFRTQPLRTGPCEQAGIPMTCAVLSINAATESR